MNSEHFSELENDIKLRKRSCAEVDDKSEHCYYYYQWQKENVDTLQVLNSNAVTNNGLCTVQRT